MCEDFWHLATPQLLALDGAQVLINVSSSPGRDVARDARGGPGHRGARGATLMRTYAQLTTSFVVFCNRVGVDESLSFWGGSEVIGPTGAQVFGAPLFEEGLFSRTWTSPTCAASASRCRCCATSARSWSRASGAAHRGARGPRRRRDRRARGRAAASTWRWTGERHGTGTAAGRACERQPAERLFELPDELAIDTDVARQVIGEFIRGQLRQAGFEKAVLGLSGGIDSALVAYLVAEAIGAERLLCVMMPYRTSSPASQGDAEEVVADLGCAAELVEITGDGGRVLRARTGCPARAGRGARGGAAAARQLHGPDADGGALRPLGDLARPRGGDRATRPSR